MRYSKDEKKRLSLFIPVKLYERLDYESNKYGITKTALVQTMIVNYYREVDVHVSRSDVNLVQEKDV